MLLDDCVLVGIERVFHSILQVISQLKLNCLYLIRVLESVCVYKNCFDFRVFNWTRLGKVKLPMTLEERIARTTLPIQSA